MYYFSKSLEGVPFEEVIEKVTEALKDQGFGVMTDIDIQATMKKKIGAEMPKYRILGACNPNFAYKALTFEDKIGTMLPCNVIVQEKEDGVVEVSAVDPIASMASVKNEALGGIATEVAGMLKQVVSEL